MPDGKRKRRFSTNEAKRRWYARSRSMRFAKRFGGVSVTSTHNAEKVAAREDVQRLKTQPLV